MRVGRIRLLHNSVETVGKQTSVISLDSSPDNTWITGDNNYVSIMFIFTGACVSLHNVCVHVLLFIQYHVGGRLRQKAILISHAVRARIGTRSLIFFILHVSLNMMSISFCHLRSFRIPISLIFQHCILYELWLTRLLKKKGQKNTSKCFAVKQLHMTLKGSVQKYISLYVRVLPDSMTIYFSL